LSRTYLAHHELESVVIIIIISKKEGHCQDCPAAKANTQQWNSAYLLDKALESRELVVAQQPVEVLVEDELLSCPRGRVIVSHLLCMRHQPLQHPDAGLQTSCIAGYKH